MAIQNGSSKRARLLGVSLLALMFVAGTFSGMAMTRALEAKEGPVVASPAPQECRQPKQSILDQLSLTEEQRARVDVILERRREQTKAFWDTTGPRLDHLMDSTRAEIRAVLTPEQRELYDRLREERRRERERHEKDRDGR